MPGRLFLSDSSDVFAAALGVPPPGDDSGPRPDAAPGEEFWLLTGPGEPLQKMRWNMIPVGRVNARGRPVMETITNARAETLFEKTAYSDVRRAVLPVSGWYEWTGEKRRKTRWRMSPADGEMFLFAAVWDAWTIPGGASLLQFATVTVEPNADVVEYHHRMPAILSQAQLPVWLGPDPEAAKSVLRPAPAGSIAVREAGFP